MSGGSAGGLCARCLGAAPSHGTRTARIAADDARVELADGVCRHHCAYPKRLRDDAAMAPMLRIRGGAERLARLLDRRVVAIVGSAAASDYGIATARRLARELGHRGMTVAVALDEGIALAAYSAAVEVAAPTIGVLARDVGRCSPAWCGRLYRDALQRGCAVSRLVLEPAHDSMPTRDSAATPDSVPVAGTPSRSIATLILALLADLTLVIEGRRGDPELACAQIRRERGLALGVVPGPFDSPSARGSNELLAAGASLVGGVGDALRLMGGSGQALPKRSASDSSQPRLELEPALRSVLERVLRGADTVDALRGHGSQAGGLELALVQLELHGLLRRSVGGRYLPSARALRG